METMDNIVISERKIPLSVLLALEAAGVDGQLEIQWTKTENDVTVHERQGERRILKGEVAVCRYLARRAPKRQLYGKSALEESQVDQWLDFKAAANNSLEELDTFLKRSSFLASLSQFTIADFLLYEQLKAKSLENNFSCSNIRRWLAQIEADAVFGQAMKRLKSINASYVVGGGGGGGSGGSGGGNTTTTPQSSVKVAAATSDQGKFVDLPGAKMGEVVVRFPPEASGYLHIGHAKAALLNQYYQLAFKGKLILRFDDTNPDKEKEDFEHVIVEDVSLLGLKPDLFTYTSDHFPAIQKYCLQLLKQGDAYVDDTDAETMKQEREARQPSKNRTNTVEQNLKLWQEMLKGSNRGLVCCVRAKIDMNSNNGCMRDPTIYRCKEAIHPRQGAKYKAYPTYDFACPIVDSVENVTHALRTTEYHDRDEQYYWVLEKLGMRKPYIYEYSRLNLTNTVLSKRKLTYLVTEGYVNGWDDPRMPTVRGILRRGLTVDGLKEFIFAQGSSKSVVTMEWDKLWAFNKKRIEITAKRYFAIEPTNAFEVEVQGLSKHNVDVAWHPKDSAMGSREITVDSTLLIDHADGVRIKPGDIVTFMNIGNVKIEQSFVDKRKIVATADLNNKDYKKTLKVSWIAKTAKNVPFVANFVENVISKKVLSPDDDFKNFIRKVSYVDVPMLGEASLAQIEKGDIIQIQRKGFFICDSVPNSELYPNTAVGAVLSFNFIPDGGTNLTSLPELARQLFEGKLEDSANSKGTESKSGTIDADSIDAQIKAVGDKIRTMKLNKASKEDLQAEVSVLLALKTQFKTATGNDWVPVGGPAPKTAPKEKKAQGTESKSGTMDADSIDAQIKAVGDKIRTMKLNKASKEDLQAEVSVLLALKTQFKTATGNDWVPAGGPAPKTAPKEKKAQGTESKSGTMDADSIDAQIKAVGDKIRTMKLNKASKEDLQAEVSVLLALKTQFKTATGNDWVPAGGPAPKTAPKEKKAQGTESKSGTMDADSIDAQIKAVGDKIRTMKLNKASKEDLQAEVSVLLALKTEFKTATGNDWVPAGGPAPKTAPKEKKAQTPKEKKAPTPKEDGKKQTRLCLEANKEENLSDWYSQVILKSEMIDYYDVSGCYILRPWAYGIWDQIRLFFDEKIKTLGVENCYFPMFVSHQALEREKAHIADFAPEVAWVTKSGTTDLAEPIAIRPTSETVMYPYYAKWIKSHRDLPVKLNQWCNVVRWEFKHPQPFLRTREFLWQEGHTAFATQQEAVEEVHQILEFYAQIYEELLAVPVIRGKKTEKEKFAGGDFTTTVEAFVPASGRGIQGATSHHLGQNFSKMFDVIFEHPETHEKQFVYQNSWGITTRTIGVMIMIHGDNQGLVIPPRIAHYQVVIIPCGITVSLSAADKKAIFETCSELSKQLRDKQLRVHMDDRENYSPGWKFNHWELKGVPVRIEVGPKDVANKQFVAVRRDLATKSTFKEVDEVVTLLGTIQSDMYLKAKTQMDEHVKIVEDFPSFLTNLDAKCIIMAPFCGDAVCEDEIKANSTRDETDLGASSMGAKTLCIPFTQPKKLSEGAKCVNPACSRKPQAYTLFGRSY